MDFAEYSDQKAGWSYKELPDGSDWAVHNKKSVNGTPIGSKLIYHEFECGSCTLKVNLFFMKEPIGGSAFIIFRYIRVEKDEDQLIENYYYLKINFDSVELRKYYSGSDTSLLPP